MINKFLVTILTSIIAFFFATSISAKECKGLNKSECSSNDDCVWVDRKDTKDYCRSKPGKGDKDDKKNDKKDSKKNDKDDKKDSKKNDKDDKKDNKKNDKKDKKDNKKKD